MRLLFFLVALPMIAIGEWKGVAYLASSAYSPTQCTVALRAFRGVDRPILATLWGTFGEKNICVERFLRQNIGRPHALEIHFSNEAGRRNRRLGSGELLREYDVRAYNRALTRGTAKRRISGRLADVQRFLSSYANSNSQVFISTGLEDNFTDRAYRAIYQQLKEAFPKYSIVRSPLRNTRLFHHAIELHGTRPKFPRGKCIASLDGIDIDLSGQRGTNDHRISRSEVRSYLGRYRNCTRLLWWDAQQGISRKRFIKPRSRNFNIRVQDVDAINRLLKGTK